MTDSISREKDPCVSLPFLFKIRDRLEIHWVFDRQKEEEDETTAKLATPRKLMTFGERGFRPIVQCFLLLFTFALNKNLIILIQKKILL